MSEREHNRDHSTGQPGVIPPIWQVCFPDGTRTKVHGFTKSEARSTLKRQLAGRIPKATTLVREDEP